MVHIGGFFGWVMGFFMKLWEVSSNNNLGAFSIELASRHLGIHPRASQTLPNPFDHCQLWRPKIYKWVPELWKQSQDFKNDSKSINMN